MRLHDVLNCTSFRRIALLLDVIKNGIMDYLVSSDVITGQVLIGLSPLRE
jgi:hypothetical protein